MIPGLCIIAAGLKEGGLVLVAEDRVVVVTSPCPGHPDE